MCVVEQSKREEGVMARYLIAYRRLSVRLLFIKVFNILVKLCQIIWILREICDGG